jgi:hypothetical protein
MDVRAVEHARQRIVEEAHVSKRPKPHPLYEGSLGQVWWMDQGNGFWAVVLCVGERRAGIGNFPCVMLACSELGWSNARDRPGTIVNISLGSAKAWKRLM